MKIKKQTAGDTARFTNYGLVLSLCIVLLWGFFSPCFAQKAKGDDVIATWGKHKITSREFEERIKAMPPENQQQLQSPEVRREFLESLVQIQVAAAEARAKKLDKNKAVAMRLKDMTDTVLLQEYMTRKINAMKPPTDKQIEAYFKAHTAEFTIPTMIKAQHILIQLDPKAKPEEVAAAQAKADGILKELAAGADFGKLAEKYSDDPGSKAQGGDLGIFSKDQMVQEFSEAAFTLKKGEVSKPVRTGFGLHIIKVNDILPGRPMELKEASDSINAKLTNEKREKLIKDEFERLRKKYNAKILMAAPKKPHLEPAPKPKQQ